MKIFLIGMPGSGKSTLGSGLAEYLDIQFYDLDIEIQKGAGQSISSIFEDQGEVEFRTMESDLLREISEKEDSFVMATGGGAPCHHEGIQYMNSCGITVYLEVGMDELIKRLGKNQDIRPLLSESKSLEQRIMKLMTDRKSCYQKAAITLQSDHISVQNILDRLKPKN